MTKKRRGFEIDLETDDVPSADTVTAQSTPIEPLPQRRGPMATAITETAGALRDRAVIEARIRAENDALAHEHVRLKKLGLITDLVPLDLIDTSKLTRDRATGDDADLAELVTSVREIGLSNPIRLEAAADGRYELVQGYRRLQAFRALLADTGDAALFGAIPAAITARGETLERLYRQMVDENLVRKDISFAEMAQMAVHYAADPGTAENDPDKAVAKLFGSAGYAKRSYIRGFIKLVEMLGETLRYAPHIPRALGLSLVQRLEAEPETAKQIRAALSGLENWSAREELDVLRRFVAESKPGLEPDFIPMTDQGPARGIAPRGPMADQTSVSFLMPSRQGQVRCVVTAGRIELRLDRDFSGIDRERLAVAVRAMLDQLL